MYSQMAKPPVWVRVDGVYFSEIRSGLNMGSPSGFLFHTKKINFGVLKTFKNALDILVVVI